MTNRLPLKDRMKDHPMFKHIIECPDEGEDRDTCECDKCIVWRVEMAEHARDEWDEDERRRGPSRAYDADYVRRRM